MPKGPEARPEGRGQTTPTTTPSCASRTPVLNQVLTGHQKSTGSPQTLPQKPHSFHMAKMHTTPSPPPHHPAHTSGHLISCVCGATPPHNHTHFAPSLTFPWPYGPHNHTGVVYLINCHGLTFDLLPRPPRHLAGVKGQGGRGTRPPITTSPLGAPQYRSTMGPQSHAQPEGRRPTFMHTQTLHTGLGTRPQA